MWQKLAFTLAAVMPLAGCAGSISPGGSAAAPAPAVATQSGQSGVFGDAATTYALVSVDGHTLPYARASGDAGLVPAVILSGSLLLQANGVFSMTTTYRETLAQGERVYEGKMTGACAPNADGFRMFSDDESEAQLSVSGDTAVVTSNRMVFQYLRRR
jgi:hypothetical protein